MKILVCYEKHGNRYLDASTPEKLGESALKVLKERWNEGYFYYAPIKPEEPPVMDLESIPEPFKEQAKNMLLDYNRALDRYTKELREYNYLKDVIENNKTDKAWKTLDWFGESDYERVSIENVE